MIDRRLRILHVNAWDTGGGAAMVARQLSRASRHRGHESWMAVGRKYSIDPDVLEIPSNPDMFGAWSGFWWNLISPGDARRVRAGTLRQRLAHGLAEPVRMLDIARGREDFNFPGTKRLLDLTGSPPDIVHAHNLHDAYFDLRELPVISHRVPTVLTLHDAWMLSGHCAHSLGCDRWLTGCGNCPDLSVPPAIRRDATRFNWQRKAAIYRASRLFVATPSRWLMRRVERSMLAEGVVDATVIPNGVDFTIFQPGDRQAARDRLHISPSARVVMFAANGITANPWKDYATIRETVERVSDTLGDESLLLLAVGEDGKEEQIGRAHIRFIPYQDDPEMVARCYQAADVYVHAARADTFPNTVIEAMACGVPVVATDVGGIPEQVSHGYTGYLTPSGDAAGLAAHIIQILSDNDLRRRLGSAGYVRAHDCFDLIRQTNAYHAWYEEILESTGARREEARHVAATSA